MISVREAVERALAFANEFPDDRFAQLWRTAQLEEVESAHDTRRRKTVWLITLSVPKPGALMPLQRDYKIFTVDRETGEVLAMKIREIAGAHG